MKKRNKIIEAFLATKTKVCKKLAYSNYSPSKNEMRSSSEEIN